jgi:hypothetical protein
MCSDVRFLEHYIVSNNKDKTFIVNHDVLGHLIFYKNWDIFVHIVRWFKFSKSEIAHSTMRLRFTGIYTDAPVWVLKFLFVDIGYTPNDIELVEGLKLLHSNGRYESFKYMSEFFNYSIEIEYSDNSINVPGGRLLTEGLDLYLECKSNIKSRIRVNDNFLGYLTAEGYLNTIKFLLDNSDNFKLNFVVLAAFAGIYGLHDVVDWILMIGGTGHSQQEICGAFFTGLVSRKENIEMMLPFATSHSHYICENVLRRCIYDVITNGSIELVKWLFEKLNIKCADIRVDGYKLIGCAFKNPDLAVLEFMLNIKGLDAEKLNKAIYKNKLYKNMDVFVYDFLYKKIYFR